VRAGATPPAAAAILLVTACAPTYGGAYLNALAEAQRRDHDGLHVEAARAYGEAADKALRVKDRDEARYRQARSFERGERWAEADAALRRLAAESPGGPRTPRAAFDRADIAIRHGDETAGYAMLEGALVRYPQDGLARTALRRLVAHVSEAAGDAAALALLDRLRPKLRGTDEDQMVDYEAALCQDRMGHKAEAHDALVAAARARPYPKGALTDDAFVRAARLDIELGRAEEATRHLREVLASREESSFMSSDERPRYPEAQMLLGEIYRDALHDHVSARREFAKVCVEHGRSLKCDDALWAEAKLARADGDAADACRVAAEITRSHPDSRYAPCARLLCPTAPEGKRACADYIRRELDDGAPARSP
jgi:tetratricopeptide (TPR) repeat protein